MRAELLWPGIIFALILCGVFYAVRVVVVARGSRTWPTVQGRVVDVLIVRREEGRRGVTFVPTLTYRYRVEGKDYEGTRIDITFDPRSRAHGSPSQHFAGQVLEGYFRGCPVVVHYRPGDPACSLLKPGASIGLYIVAAAAILGAVGLVAVWLFLAP